MKPFLIAVLLVCSSVYTEAQTNFVKNGDLELYSKCPDDWNEIYLAKFWRNATDSVMNKAGMEYYNACGNTSLDNGLHIPNNLSYWQYPHSGQGMAGAHLYYDKSGGASTPAYPLPFNYRDCLQGHLYKPLIAGKSYCVSFWVNLTEASGYAHNKIGAYLDDGSINSIADTAGEEITTVTPQVYTNTILADTMNWVKIEGSFVANGNETYISIGNFFPNSSVSAIVTDYRFAFENYSYYLVDDISVVPVDAIAHAGVDRWVELGKQTQIGPVEDSTARGMDCKWYYKSKLIDSGNVITVSASTIKYAVDTYVVVQNVCGKTTRDTMLLRTVGAGMSSFATTENTFTISPNPSNGKFVINDASLRGGTTKQSQQMFIKVYDLLGRVVYEQSLILTKAQTPLELNLAKGTYIVELRTEEAVLRERILIAE
jgi:hypothetical protein